MRGKLRSALTRTLAGLFWLLSMEAAFASPNGPVGLAVSPDGSRLYVASTAVHSGHLVDAISVIDAGTFKVLATFRPKGDPFLYTLAISPDGSHLYLSEYGAVDVLDPATGQLLTSIKAGPLPISLAPSPDGRRLYVANTDLNPVNPSHPLHPDGGLTVIDSIADKTITTLELGRMTSFAAVSADGHRLYSIGCDCASYTPRPVSTIRVIDADTLQVIAADTPQRSLGGAALSPDGKRLYVTSTSLTGTGGRWDPRVDVYDTATDQVTASVKVSDQNYVFAERPMVSLDGKRVYLSMANSPEALSVLDAQTLRITSSLTLPGGAWLMAQSPDGKRLYTAGGPGDAVTVTAIDTSTLKPTGTVQLGPLTAAP